jgi:hypothetical protein
LLKQLDLIPVDDYTLEGSYEIKAPSELNWHNWINGVYQSKADGAATDHIGFRGYATRLRNQLDFSLFKLAHSDKAIVGKDNILFDEWYLNAWSGRTFIGKDFIDIKLHKLKMVQDTMRKNGTELFFVLAPDKATFFEDKIPDYYKKHVSPENNYSYLSQRAKEIGVNHIDFNKYFLSIKDTSRYALYPKGGIHWTNYGAYFALDSIIKYIESIKKIDLNDISIESLEVTHSPHHPDYDIGKNINLLCMIPQWEMAYPKLSYENNPGKPKPKLLVSGDSYYFNIFNYDFTSHLFQNNAFWYYAMWVYPETYLETTASTDLDFRKEMEEKDIIMLMVTSRFMHNIDWLVIEKLFDIYYPDILWKNTYDKRTTMHIDHDYFYWLLSEAEKRNIPIAKKMDLDAEFMLSNSKQMPVGKSVFDFMAEMQNDSAWLESIKKKAQENKLTLRDQQIRDGLYLFKAYDQKIKDITTEIGNNPDWVQQVAEKAEQSGISLERQMRIEAVYVEAEGSSAIYKEKMTDGDKLKLYIEKIKADPAWMKSIAEKAAQNNISVEEQLKLDAKWTMENE